jgi:D-arabinose 1-dehydrogenase-like Zn-dependent alcohol dehydrogenase
MKAMVLHAPDTPFELDERPDPVAGEGEIVARVLACGSGLTIHHTVRGRTNATFPRVIGHEILGEIVEIGPGVAGFAVGDRVTNHAYITCGHCKWCRADREPLCDNLAGFVGRHVDGGYAEYVRLPARTFVRVPESLDHKRHPAEIAVICDAIVTPWKVLKRGRITALDTVAVIGAGGGVGIHMVMLAKWAHARVVAVDIAADKLAKCREIGADATVDASQGDLAAALRDAAGGGVDVVVDFVSSRATLEAGLAALGKAGRLVTLGGNAHTPFAVSAANLLVNEIDVLGSKSFTAGEIGEALALCARREVWPLVTETWALDQANTVHERLEAAAIIGRAAIVM